MGPPIGNLPSTGGPGSTSASSTPSSSASSRRSARRHGSTSGPSIRWTATSSIPSGSSASVRSRRISTRSSGPRPRTPASSCSCRASTTTRTRTLEARLVAEHPAPDRHPVLDVPARPRGRRGGAPVEADAALARRAQPWDPERGLVRLELPDGARGEYPGLEARQGILSRRDARPICQASVCAAARRRKMTRARRRFRERIASCQL